MDPWKKALLYLACSGWLIVGIPGSVLSLAAQQAAGAEHDLLAGKTLLSASTGQSANVSELPDSPGATVAKAEEVKQQNPTQQTMGDAPPSKPQPPQPSGARTRSTSETPVGTAVAESPNASGIAASQPAGVAIAPAKQRRVRTIVLRMGALVGAGVAVGSVVALTAATSSKPPGAH